MSVENNKVSFRGKKRFIPHLAIMSVPFILGVLIAIIPVSALMIIPIVLLWIVSSLFFIISTIIEAIKGNRRSALFKGTLVFAFIFSVWLIRVGTYIGWIGHLLVFSTYYDAEVAKIGGMPGDRLKLFPWGGYLIFDDIYLAYDDSDSLLLSDTDEAEIFRTKLLAQTQNIHWDTTHLWAHYYVLDVHG